MVCLFPGVCSQGQQLQVSKLEGGAAKVLRLLVNPTEDHQEQEGNKKTQKQMQKPNLDWPQLPNLSQRERFSLLLP